MTRLYYDDSRLARFEARVVEAGEEEGRPWVVLDRTAFYPTSGGQPHDLGTLGGAAVLDVFEREEGGAVVHVLDRPLTPGTAVIGEIDWPRRRDHMQQHTGQHLLSAAFIEAAGVPTVSFHLGRELSTIDLQGAPDGGAFDRVEDLANEVARQNRPVTVRTASAEEAATLPLRKPPARSGPLRLVEIERFDLSACGGTHVSSTGEIGAIVLAGWERYKGGTRVSFVCGERALRQVRAWRAAIGAASRALSVGPGELAQAIARLQDEQKSLRQRLKGVADELVAFEAEGLARSAVPAGAALAVASVLPDRDVQHLKALAQALATRAGYVAVLVSSERPASVAVGANPDESWSAAEIVGRLVDRFGGRGGGRRELAQAGGLDAPGEAIREAALALLAGEPT